MLLNGAFKDPVTNKTTLLPQTTTIGPVENDTSTRSVLDALKEISRKRIHTNEVTILSLVNESVLVKFFVLQDLEDTLDPCKKQKKETSKKEAYQKRAREDSPQGDSLAKRSCCYIDAFTASVTSSQRYKQELEKGVKRKEMLENKRKEKIVKLNQDVETQTRSKETSLPVVEKSTSTEEIVEEQIKEEEDVPWMPVFDDRPLAEARKKRLAKLLGSLTGHKPYIEPPTDDTETFAKQRQREEEEKKQQEAEEKKLVSILSPPNKAKHDKHVTFNMQPQTTSVESIVVISESTATTDQSTITTATVSSSEAREKPVPPVLFGFNSNTTTVSAISSPVTTSLPLATNITSTISSAIATPTFSFGKPTITSPPHTTIAAASPPKIGGFKFDLIASSTATTVTSAISTSGFTATTTSLGNFKIPTTSAFTIPPFKKESETTKTTMSSGFKLPAATSQSFVLPSTTPSFSIPTSTVSQNSNSAAAITSSTFTLSTPTTANFMFNKASSTTPTTTIAATKPFLFTPTTSSGMPKNLFSSGSSGGGFANPTTTTASFSFSPTATSTTTGFAVAKTTNIFGTVSSAPTFGQTSAVPAFGTTATTKKGTTTSSMMPFGIAKTSAPSIFAQTTIAPSTGNVFGSTTPAFGVVSTITTTATSNNTPTAPIFGSVTTTISSSIFGTQTPSVNVFGTSTTTAPSFTAAFSAAVTTASLFGATSTAITTAAPVFGSSYAGTATTTSSSLFPSASPSFGAQTTTTDATKPVNIFSSGGAPSFGSSQPGGFGGFGANTTSPFGATSSGFGATKQETPKVFGTPSTPAFGTSSTPTFGASSDKSSAFGNTTTAPAFGGFNAPAKPAFTAANTASPQTSNVFGASNQSAPFGAHNANQSFGSSSNVPQTGSAFTFGAAANSTAKPAAFNFGANTEPPKPGGFNFGATAPPSFGASSPAFGGNFTSQFNAPAAGTFSIGSGSAPNRSRTTLRAKRRN